MCIFGIVSFKSPNDEEKMFILRIVSLESLYNEGNQKDQVQQNQYSDSHSTNIYY